MVAVSCAACGCVLDAAAIPDCSALLDVELENCSVLAPDAGPVCSADLRVRLLVGVLDLAVRVSP